MEKELKAIKYRLYLYYGSFVVLFLISLIGEKYKFVEVFRLAIVTIFFIVITSLWVLLYSAICPSCKKSFFTKSGMPPFYFSGHCKHCNLNINVNKNNV